MEQLENYHYAAIMLAMAKLYDEYFDVNRHTDGEDLQRKTYYDIEGLDGKFKTTLSFFSMPKEENPYKKDLFDMLNYLSEKRSKSANFIRDVDCDKEMYRRASYFFCQYAHLFEYKLKFASTKEQVLQIFDEMGKPLKDVQEWKKDVVENYLPFTREDMIVTATGTLIADVLDTNYPTLSSKLTEQDIKNIMFKALKQYGFSKEQLFEQFARSEKLPLSKKSSEVSGSQMQ